jgi:hypothetical protein
MTVALAHGHTPAEARTLSTFWLELLAAYDATHL